MIEAHRFQREASGSRMALCLRCMHIAWHVNSSLHNEVVSKTHLRIKKLEALCCKSMYMHEFHHDGKQVGT